MYLLALNVDLRLLKTLFWV